MSVGPGTVDDWQLSLASICARHLSCASIADTLALSSCKLVPQKMHFNVFSCFKLIISWPFSCFLWPFCWCPDPLGAHRFIILYCIMVMLILNSKFPYNRIFQNFSPLTYFYPLCQREWHELDIQKIYIIICTLKYQLIKGELILKTVLHAVMLLWPSDIWLHFLWNPCIFAREESLAKD